MIDTVKFNAMGRGPYLVRRTSEEFIQASGLKNPADRVMLEKLIKSVVDACIEAVKNTPTVNCQTSHDVAMAEGTIKLSIETIKSTFGNGN